MGVLTAEFLCACVVRAGIPALALRLAKVVSAFAFLIFLAEGVFAQPGIKEFPTIEKPRERPSSERITIRSVPVQPTKGVLAVVLDPVIKGQVIVKDIAGKVVAKQEADQDGQAEFQLQRGKAYQIEASSPGYHDASGKSKPLKSNEVVRLKLVPEFAQLILLGLPANAQVSVDNQSRATADQNGIAEINELKAGDHSIIVRHPDYNDYVNTLRGIKVGEVARWNIPLTRVAKLTVQGPAGATVLINGAVQGKINFDGSVRIDYELDQAGERTITVELTGYQTATRKETLAPGARTIAFNLDPIVTSAGWTDYFERLSQWNAPATWKLEGDDRNKKLHVEGAALGLLKDKIYRDLEGNFTLWLDDGKGAAWAVRADKEGRNYYLFHLTGPKSSDTPRRFFTYVVRDGGPPELVSTPVPVSMNLNQNTSYTISLAVTGNSIQHWITSNQTGEKVDLGIWTDTSPTKDKFLFGTFGFRSVAGEIFTVDDLNLEPAKP